MIGTLKQEYGLDDRFSNHAQVGLAVKQAIHYYNTDRPHLSLNMAVPSDVYWRVHHDVPTITIPDKGAPTL